LFFFCWLADFILVERILKTARLSIPDLRFIKNITGGHSLERRDAMALPVH
jgi:hypothetical protein